MPFAGRQCLHSNLGAAAAQGGGKARRSKQQRGEKMPPCPARPQWWGAVLGLLLVAAVEGQGNYQPEVATKYGRLRGKLASVKGTGQSVNVFLGIPFAKPPVGALRFSPPQPPEPWSHVRESTSNPPMCLQDLGWIDTFRKMMKGNFLNLPVSEDCLYLNVFTPDLKAKLPVMVWIHGGALILGAASMLDGSALSAYEHVVVVMIQYRLGLPGFFSTGSKDARGNWGLLDQTAALQWVQENIELFGGDPHSVTIFGESAGGFCASAHMLSPLSKGLFHRAISESGVVLLPSLFTKNPETMVQKVANISGCEISGAAMVSCLRSKTEEELHTLNTKVSLEIGIIPAVIDGEFILKDPEELLAKMELNTVPYLSGMNNHEYGWVISQALNFSDITEGMDRETITAAFQQITSGMGIPLESVQMILDEYLGDTEDPTKLREHFQDLMGDIMFVIPAIQTARYHRGEENVLKTTTPASFALIIDVSWEQPLVDEASRRRVGEEPQEGTEWVQHPSHACASRALSRSPHPPTYPVFCFT